MHIYSRDELGSRPFASDPPRVPLSARRWVIWHYPGAGTPPRGLAAYRRWIERIHMDERGWRSAGYNFFIAADGSVGEGCGRDVQGAHSPPHNYDGIGVNIWTSNGVPTQAGLDAARELYDLLCLQAGRKLSVGWHGMDYPTECPGPAIRKWAQAGMPHSGTTRPIPATPVDATPEEDIMASIDDLRKVIREELDSHHPNAQLKINGLVDSAKLLPLINDKINTIVDSTAPLRGPLGAYGNDKLNQLVFYVREVASRDGIDTTKLGQVLADSLRGDVVAAVQAAGDSTPEQIADAVVAALGTALTKEN